jgi:hypothetical protein
MKIDPISVLTDTQADDLCPAPLDCGDLAEVFRADKAAAVCLLMTLTSIQLNLQALTYAAYLSQRHGLDLDMDDVLANWQQDLEYALHTT